MTRWTPALVHVADALTAARVVIAIALIPIIARGDIDVAAALLAMSWCTDMLDGRVARMTASEGRLGAWDLAVDTAVGTAVLLGLALARHAPTQAMAVAVLLGGVFVVTGNAAAGLALQTIAYGWFLVIAWQHGSVIGRWLLPAVIAVLLVIDFDRFTTVEVPRFISGVANVGKRHRARQDPRHRQR
jgi:phosphatidylglycerophosphate synthase